MEKRNILCVIAHPDDLELMAGGSIARWIDQGASVNVLTFTDGVWIAPDGRMMREPEEALLEEQDAAEYLGYSVENLRLPAMDIQFRDEYVLEVLKRIEKHKPDTLLTSWSGDVHHDHEVVSRITLSASRRVPRVLMGQINYYLRDFFTPNIFSDISNTWYKKIQALKCFSSQWSRAGQINYYLRDFFTPNIFSDISNTWYKKIQALKCFSSQWSRAGQDWYDHLDVTSKYYGKIIGVERAEGFVSVKYLE